MKSSRRILDKIRNVDVFAFLNALLFVFMCMVVYYDRFLQYRGRGNVHEFFIYALVILLVIGIAWRYLRRFTFKSWILVLVQCGILAHFAGAFVPIDGERLYDVHILGIRYDKYVHFLNAFAAAAVASHLFDVLKAHLPLIRNLVILLVVLGLGTMVEIMEYLVMLSVPDAGIGSYDNNMQDLVGNLAGGTFFCIVAYVHSRMRCALTRHCEL